jgi:colanic acid biosynthesis glycosyl transferase WcaI
VPERNEQAGGTERRKRILVLTHYYRPEPNFITADVAEDLGRYSDVMVITAHPNYPTGRFYPGTRPWRFTRVREGGVTVWRIPHIADHSTSKWRRGMNFLSFTLVAAITAIIVGGRPDVVWVYHTPFTTALSVIYLRLVRKTRVVYTCADLWPESFFAAGVTQPGRLADALYRYSRWILRFADEIVCTTRGTAARFARDGFPPERLHFIPVWVGGIPELLPPSGEPVPADPSPSIVYAGNLGAGQGLETVIRAVAALQQEVPGLRLDLYGTGVMEAALRALAEDLGARNVCFRGRVSPAEAFAASARAAAQIVTLRPSPLFRMTIPSKLTFCFAAGAPILCGLSGEASELAERSGGALQFDASSVDSLRLAILRLLALSPVEVDGMRRSLRAFYHDHFRRDLLLAEYRTLLLDDGPHTSSRHTAEREDQSLVATANAVAVQSAVR